MNTWLKSRSEHGSVREEEFVDVIAQSTASIPMVKDEKEAGSQVRLPRTEPAQTFLSPWSNVRLLGSSTIF
jgi:hypothetical protein